MKPPYYVRKSEEYYLRYVGRLIYTIVEMYPYACEHGIRYYFDTKFRRHHSRCRKDRIRAEREVPIKLKSTAARNRVKSELIERDGQICLQCLCPFLPVELTIDHILSLYNGGDSDFPNLQLLCVSCYREKSKQENMEQARLNPRPRTVFHLVWQRLKRRYVTPILTTAT